MNRGRKQTLFRPISLTSFFALSLVIAACGGAVGPDPDPGPGSCAHTLSGNVISHVVLAPSGAECDYLLTGTVRVSADLVVQAGTRVRAAEGALIIVEDGGSIQAQGTQEQRIEFVGAKAVRGSWYGFCFGLGHHESWFDHVDVYWAGGVFSPTTASCRAAIGAFTPRGAPVHITNSVIVGSHTSGIDATEFTLGEFRNNLLAGHVEYGLRVAPGNVGRLDASSNYGALNVPYPDGSSAANGRPYVFISSGTQDNSDGVQEWRPLDVPCYTTHYDFPYDKDALFFEEGTTTAILPGTEIVMADGGLWVVQESALLLLLGTPEESVVLTGDTEAPGAWEGIWVHGGGLVADNAEVAYAGDDSGLVIEGGVTFYHLGRPSHCSHLRNVTIRGSASNGVFVDDDTAPYVRLESMTYTDVALEGQVGNPHGPAVLGVSVVDCP